MQKDREKDIIKFEDVEGNWEEVRRKINEELREAQEWQRKEYIKERNKRRAFCTDMEVGILVVVAIIVVSFFTPVAESAFAVAGAILLLIICAVLGAWFNTERVFIEKEIEQEERCKNFIPPEEELLQRYRKSQKR